MEPIDVTYDICRCYIRDHVDCDPALWRLVDGFHRSRNLAGLTSCSCHFDFAKHKVEDWRFLRQIEAFFKKNAIFSNKLTCSNAAQHSFMSAELACNETNKRLEFFYVKRDQLDPDLNSKISRMERYICNVLGNFSSFLDSLPSLVRVTPGATAHTSRRESCPQQKLKMKLYATHTAASYLRALYRYYGFKTPKIKPVLSNRVELVPKNWKTSRTIACEPEGNLPLQLAFDTYAKRRLRRFGIDLRSQSANQCLAKAASINNDFVTVDFASASDTISYNTVAWLFPPEWFSYLDRIRSPRYRGCFGEGSYYKFSSMGNGSTFCIETLIFAAACYAVGSRNFLVYGDDVIIEKEFYEDYLRLTRFLGFSINVSKTFHDGPFRESCGLDAFDGIDVTPTYIRNIDGRKAVLCHLVNSMARLTLLGGHLERYLVNLIVSQKLPIVPFQESTLSGIWIYPEDARSLGVLRRKHGIDKFRAYVPSGTSRRFDDSRGYYLWFLNKNRQVLFSSPWIKDTATTFPEQTSSVPLFDHKYVRKWVGWFPPKAVPVHLYRWTEMVLARKL